MNLIDIRLEDVRMGVPGEYYVMGISCVNPLDRNDRLWTTIRLGPQHMALMTDKPKDWVVRRVGMLVRLMEKRLQRAVRQYMENRLMADPDPFPWLFMPPKV